MVAQNVPLLVAVQSKLLTPSVTGTDTTSSRETPADHACTDTFVGRGRLVGWEGTRLTLGFTFSLQAWVLSHLASYSNSEVRKWTSLTLPQFYFHIILIFNFFSTWTTHILTCVSCQNVVKGCCSNIIFLW